MNLAVCNLPSLLEKLFTQNVTNITFIFETSPNTNPEEKKVGDMAYYIPPPEKVGDTSPYSPPNCAHVTNHDSGPDYKLHQPKLHGSPPSKYTLY